MTYIELSVTRFIEHEDYTKCGQCWREHINSEVAKEFVAAGKATNEDVPDFMKEVNRRWRETSIYKEVKKLMSQGKTLEEVSDLLKKDGIEI